ncbi:MAG: hypothetical protein OXC38_07105, partial [Gammaproteobacteria bacterium]|nr:hypothetical protein [Gammaproteobacteria bacterium]
RREKRFTSILGRLRLNRAYYHCPDCGYGHHPRDRALGMEGTSLSPGATRLTGFAAAETSFERSRQLLKVLAGLAVSAKQAESAACRGTGHDLPPFAQRVAREAKRQAVLGDGAAWIWNTVSEQFPQAIQIVDLFHAKERLWKVARDAYGNGSDLAAAWAAVGYVQNNRDRMRYAEFRRQGLCVSSGVVESGCKQVVGHRLKRGGMHWTVTGGNAIIALKCCILSNRFEDFWARRARPATDLIEDSLSDGNAKSTGLKPKSRPLKAA